MSHIAFDLIDAVQQRIAVLDGSKGVCNKFATVSIGILSRSWDARDDGLL